MKFIILPFLFICLALHLQAQQPSVYNIDTTGKGDTITPYNPKGRFRTWSIKGKVLPFILGNAGGVSGLLGLEYGFANNQSIGIDGFFEYEENSNDNVPDTAGVQHAVGDYWHSWERAIFLNYRYYFNFQQLRKRKGIALYSVAFLRYGKIDRSYDPLYPLSSYLSNHERHYSAGILIGGTLGFEKPKRLGLDINFGVFEKEKVISTVYLENGIERTTRGSPIAPGFRLSVNLSWWFIHK